MQSEAKRFYIGDLIKEAGKNNGHVSIEELRQIDVCEREEYKKFASKITTTKKERGKIYNLK